MKFVNCAKIVCLRAIIVGSIFLFHSKTNIFHYEQLNEDISETRNFQ